MAGKGLSKLSGGHFPEKDVPLIVARSQRPAVGGKRQGIDAVLLILAGANLPTAADSPEMDLGIPAARGQELAVRRKGDYLTASLPGAHLANFLTGGRAVQVDDAHLAHLIARGNHVPIWCISHGGN